MAKTIRSIKADLCDDETLGAIPRDARFLFVGLITRADDHGRFRANPAFIKSRIYPYDDDVTAAMVGCWLDALARAGRIVRYRESDQLYGFIPTWAKHQRIDNAAKSELPEPPEGVTDCGGWPPTGGNGGEPPQPAANDGELRPWSAAGREGKGVEGIGGEPPLPPHDPPRAELVVLGAAEEGMTFAESWHVATGGPRRDRKRLAGEITDRVMRERKPKPPQRNPVYGLVDRCLEAEWDPHRLLAACMAAKTLTPNAVEYAYNADRPKPARDLLAGIRDAYEEGA